MKEPKTVWVYPEQPRLPDEGVVDYLLRIRGVDDKTSYISPQLSQDVHSWELLHDAKRAAEEIMKAVEQKRRIFIHGDFDVDGVSATSMLWEFLYREVGADVLPYIPSRFDEGYGLSQSSVEAMLEQGAELVVTVDCGIKDIELVEEYSKGGLDFIITDHHTLAQNEKGKPIVSESALAVVHPQHPKGRYPFSEICGAAVAWKLICALNDVGNLKVDVSKYLDLVALATVCDIMPLIDENRTFVIHGLNQIKKGSRLGIAALLREGNIKSQDIETYHLGFVIGPRINAAGRLDSALHSVRALTTDSVDHAHRNAAKLSEFNRERQKQTGQLLESAQEMISEQEDNLYHFVYGADWPEGIVGLVAGKLAEKYNRPVMIGSLKDGHIKASARSVSGFHITEALRSLEDLLEKYGGHELAAGFTIPVSRVEEFQSRLFSYAQETIPTGGFVKKISIDVDLLLSDLSLDLAAGVDLLGPFGFGNPKPILTVDHVTIDGIRIFGHDRNHISFGVAEETDIELISFNGAERYADIRVGDVVEVAGQLGINEWNGRRKLQLRIKDMRRK